MPDRPYSSQFTYTDDELELNKVIAFVQAEMKNIRRDDEDFNQSLGDSIVKAEKLARKKGITYEEFLLFKLHAQNGNVGNSVPEPMHSWDEIVDEADAAIPGYVTLEDICSAEDFEDAFRHLDEIDKEFKKKTGLTKTDVAFIVIAIALQCTRQYVLQPFLDKFRMTDKQNAKIVNKVIPKSWQDILCGSVPYDATTRLDPKSDSTGLSGNTHRYRTLGHDPLLGWLFGPVSILSDTLTKSDFVTSYEVIDMKIGSPILTPVAFYRAYEQAKIRFSLLVASVVRQFIHFGSDYFTKQGLPIPIISSVNNDVSKFLIQNNINMLNISEGMALSTLINVLVSTVHKLFNTNKISPELYEVRTRKILSISNTIASASNIAIAAITKNVKILDLGGLLITIRRLCSDARFIARVKQEFIEGKLNDEWARISEEIDRLCSG